VVLLGGTCGCRLCWYSHRRDTREVDDFCYFLVDIAEPNFRPHVATRPTQWSQVQERHLVWIHRSRANAAVVCTVAIQQARVDGATWIGHIDTDELVYPAGSADFSMHQILNSISPDVRSHAAAAMAHRVFSRSLCMRASACLMSDASTRAWIRARAWEQAAEHWRSCAWTGELNFQIFVTVVHFTE
jgi:hypothetical protein